MDPRDIAHQLRTASEAQARALEEWQTAQEQRVADLRLQLANAVEGRESERLARVAAEEELAQLRGA